MHCTCVVFGHVIVVTLGGSDDEDEDILDDDEPQLDTVMIQHNGAINRIRV